MALRRTYSYLEQDGIFRFVLPDLEPLAKSYISPSDPGAAIRFSWESGVGMINRPRGIMAILRRSIGNSSHLWLWDFKSIKTELEGVGFREIHRTKFGHSSRMKSKLLNCLGDGTISRTYNVSSSI